MTELAPGSHVTPSLRLVRKLGAGGMGSVWIADHVGLRTQVVVKFMSEKLVSSPEALVRFSREATAASLVKSPHVVHMIDHGVLSSGVPFIAMELMEGHDLAHRLATARTLPPRQLATVVVQVAKALARAHERGIVHRDIKPDNIFLSDGGGGEAFVKVLDFGIAKGGDPHASMSQTKTGAALGTPYYMSPEQMTGSKSIDYRTDLWSLGVVVFEALTGVRPFEGETIGALAVAICSGPMPCPSSASAWLPESLRERVDAWFARACARNAGDRFSSAKELAEAFEAAVGGCERVPFAHAAGGDLALLPTETPSGVAPAKVATTTAAAVSQSNSREPRRRWGVAVAAIAGVAALGVAGVVVMESRATPKATDLPTTSAETRYDPSPSSSIVNAAPVLSLVASPSAPPEVIPTSSGSPSPANVPTSRPTSPSVKRVPSAAPPQPNLAPKPNCDPPYTLDATGKKHLKQECL